MTLDPNEQAALSYNFDRGYEDPVATANTIRWLIKIGKNLSPPWDKTDEFRGQIRFLERKREEMFSSVKEIHENQQSLPAHAIPEIAHDAIKSAGPCLTYWHWYTGFVRAAVDYQRGLRFRLEKEGRL